MKLFSPIRVGAIDLGHRVVHAPTTRLRALPDRLRHDLPLTHYVRDAFWGGDERNDIDFPRYDAASAA